MSDLETRTVSVVIPAHNAAATLRACISSIRASQYKGSVEIIVVDDASRDDTAAIADSLGCTVVRRRSNGGPALSRNAGANAAKGDILLFVDADTEMLPNTITEAVFVLAEQEAGAVVGMYEPEPINHGFFERYYAYLKFHAYTCSAATRLLAFGAHCGAISKRLFEQVGGYRSIAWGVDVENEELGRRINEVQPVVLARNVRVRHNFPGFRKLLMVFTRRVYWWVLFQRYHRVDETILMTRWAGITTSAAPSATLFGCATLVMPGESSSHAALGLAIASGLLFLIGYRGFWKVCLRRGGIAFTLAAIVSTYFFSHVILASATLAHWVATWRSFRGRGFPFVEAALGQT